MDRAAWWIVLAVVAGCYKTPRAPCAFLCGEGGDCPSGYVCGDDNRCHQVIDGVPAECEGTLPGQPDAPVGVTVDAPVSEPDAPAPVEEIDARPPPVFDAPPVSMPDAPEPEEPDAPPPPAPDAPPPSTPDAPGAVDAAAVDAA